MVFMRCCLKTLLFYYIPFYGYLQYFQRKFLNIPNKIRTVNENISAAFRNFFPRSDTQITAHTHQRGSREKTAGLQRNAPGISREDKFRNILEIPQPGQSILPPDINLKMQGIPSPVSFTIIKYPIPSASTARSF